MGRPSISKQATSVISNGIGRRRKKASIGIHNLDVIKPPVKYTVVGSDHAFVPLGGGSGKSMAVKRIIEETQTGQEYGHLLPKGMGYPVIIDSKGMTLSFPPVINSEATKVDSGSRNLFVEVTATDKKAADDMLALFAITLADAGFEIRSVTVNEQGRRRDTPEMAPAKMSVDAAYVNETIGLELSPAQMVTCLKKCRLDARARIAKGNNKKTNATITCSIPRYRTDIFHPIDLVEEVAIGYGLYNIEPTFPYSPSAGQRSSLSTYLDVVRGAMTGLGMIEALTFSLSSRDVQYELAGRTAEAEPLAVEGSKSAEHDILRDSIVPSLLQSLAKNVHEEYPQRLFEIGKVFSISRKAGKINESWHIAAVIAHGEADYTEIKSALQALLGAFGIQAASAKASQDPLYISGRCAAVMYKDRQIGTVGEVTPLAIDNFRLRVPVAAFEIDLSSLLSHE